MNARVVLLVVTTLSLALCVSSGQVTYTVTNLNADGAGSFAEAVALSNSDGQDSRIEFAVGGTIHPGARYELTAGNCTICATAAPPPGITFDCNNASSAFLVSSSGNRFCNIRIINTAVNADGITLAGANNVVERCSFDFCRDEAVGITGTGARGNVVASSRIENCGSQPGDGTNWANGRGILVTSGASATLVGSFVYHCNRGVTTNSTNGFSDVRNCRIEYSLSPASGHGVNVDGPARSNVLNSVSSNNALAGFRMKSGASFYRSGLAGAGNPTGLVSIDADCTEVASPIAVADTPFPPWLSTATTPSNLSDVGMGTGDCQCQANGGGSSTFFSTSTQDGYVRESSESSGVGGFADATGNLRVGDTNTRLQQVGVLSFDTSAIPDDAQIVSASLTIYRQGVSGNPTSLGALVADIKNGYYGTQPALATNDFEAVSSASAVGSLPYPSANKTPYSCTLDGSALAHVNKSGTTQIKLRFTADDDNDTTNDYLTLFDGANVTYRPVLQITWQ